MGGEPQRKEGRESAEPPACALAARARAHAHLDEDGTKWKHPGERDHDDGRVVPLLWGDRPRPGVDAARRSGSAAERATEQRPTEHEWEGDEHPEKDNCGHHLDRNCVRRVVVCANKVHDEERACDDGGEEECSAQHNDLPAVCSAPAAAAAAACRSSLRTQRSLRAVVRTARRAAHDAREGVKNNERFGRAAALNIPAVGGDISRRGTTRERSRE